SLITIQWSSTYPEADPINSVDVLFDSVAACAGSPYVIASSTENDGFYEWDPTVFWDLNFGGTPIGGGQAQGYICIRDSNDASILDDSDSVFFVIESSFMNFDFTPTDDASGNYTISDTNAVEIAGGA